MNADFTRPERQRVATETTPVDRFPEAHAGILAGLHAMAGLPALVHAAQRAREISDNVVELMDHAVAEHHRDEEQELFPAVLRGSAPGEERERVRALVTALKDDHRDIEDLWKRLRPQVLRAAHGEPAQLRQEMVDLLVAAYTDHARCEERDFLPLAVAILQRGGNQQEALRVAMHLHHRQVPIAYL